VHFLDEVPRSRVELRARHGVLGVAVALGAVGGSLLGLAVLGVAAHRTLEGGWNVALWVLGAPVGTVLSGVLLLAAQGLLEVLGATFLPTNWFLALADDGVYLHLRSYRNHRFPRDEDPTVAFLSWAEIAGARRVRERLRRELHGEPVEETQTWLELELFPGVDTAPLAARLERERRREGPERSFLGIRWRGRHVHAPVLVLRPGVVQLEWPGRRVARAIAGRVPFGGGSTRHLDGPEAGADLDARLLGLIRRGRRIAAIELARRETGESTTAAVARIERLEAGNRAA